MNAQKKVVLITGASSGIGYATAVELARRGCVVWAGARRTDRLGELADEITQAGGTIRTQQLDVTDPDDVRAFADAALAEDGRIDVVVNNAGVMPLSPLARLRMDDWNRMIDVNIRGVLHGIAAVLPHMLERGEGHVINVSSLGGHRVTPQAAVYSGTKYAVMAISEGLRLESGDVVRVTVISPGSTESELADSITDPDARERMKSFRADSIPASAIADAIAYAIEQPRDVTINEVIVRPTINNV